MQRRNLIVKVFTLLIETPSPACHYLTHRLRGNGVASRQIGGQLEKVERPPRIAVGRRADEVKRFLRYMELARESA